MRCLLCGSLFAAAVAAAAACATVTYKSDYDPQAAFSELHSYDWLDSADGAGVLAGISPFLERRIRRAVDQSLAGRNMVLRPDGEVDVLITAVVITPEGSRVAMCSDPSAPCSVRAVSVYMSFGYPYGYGFPGPWHRRAYPYWAYPWGYAHSYRIGFGYTWIPLQSQPGGRLPGTLIIDVFDGNSEELIWRGWAEGALAGMTESEEQQAYVDQVVERILEDFPPGEGR